MAKTTASRIVTSRQDRQEKVGKALGFERVETGFVFVASFPETISKVAVQHKSPEDKAYKSRLNGKILSLKSVFKIA